MADIDGGHVVAVVPADCTSNPKKLVKAGGDEHAAMLERSRGQVVTGYITGGISPIGHRPPHRACLVDSTSLDERIYVSAGRRSWSLAIAPDDDLRATHGSYSDTAGSL